MGKCVPWEALEEVGRSLVGAQGAWSAVQKPVLKLGVPLWER